MAEETMKEYIFGYGSLINARSRLRTTTLTHPDDAIAVLVKGFTRSWSVRCYARLYTALGCTTADECSRALPINGVIFRVTDEELALFDVREVGYRRVEVPMTDVAAWDVKDPLPPNARIWAYTIDLEIFPNEEHPLAQTYIDVIIAGCLDFGADFVTQFISSTWSSPLPEAIRDQYQKASLSETVDYYIFPWYNDRGFAKYWRPDPEAAKGVDNLLAEIISAAFAVRQESAIGYGNEADRQVKQTQVMKN